MFSIFLVQQFHILFVSLNRVSGCSQLSHCTSPKVNFLRASQHHFKINTNSNKYKTHICRCIRPASLKMKKTKINRNPNPIIISRKLRFHYWEARTLRQPAESALPRVISHKTCVVSVRDLVNIPASQPEQHKPRFTAQNMNADSFPSGILLIF